MDAFHESFYIFHYNFCDLKGYLLLFTNLAVATNLAISDV